MPSGTINIATPPGPVKRLGTPRKGKRLGGTSKLKIEAEPLAKGLKPRLPLPPGGATVELIIEFVF
jgi:hypothetical protein